MTKRHNITNIIFMAIRKTFHKNKFSLTKLRKALHIFRIAMQGERWRKKMQKEHRSIIPPISIFSITWDCNLECVGCYAANYENKNTLSPEEIRSVGEKLIAHGTYLFIIGGGEPLSVPGILDIFGSLKAGLFLIFTNGTLIDEEKAELLKKYDNIIPIVSIEGEELFTEERRGAGVPEKINSLLDCFHKKGIPFGFSSMATHKNYQYITSREFQHKMVTTGAVLSFIIDYIPFPFSLDKSLILTDADNKMKQEILDNRRKDVDILIFNFPSDEYATGDCASAGRMLIHINAYGDIEPCPFSHYAVDNILDVDYIAALNSEFFKRIRKSFCKTDNYGQCLLFREEATVKEIARATNAHLTETYKGA